MSFFNLTHRFSAQKHLKTLAGETHTHITHPHTCAHTQNIQIILAGTLQPCKHNNHDKTQTTRTGDLFSLFINSLQFELLN